VYKKGRIPWNKGLKTGALSKEHREKIGAKLLGKPKSAEHCENISKSKMGDNNPMKRIDVRLKASKSLKGRKAWNKGKKMLPMSDEHKEKIRVSMLGKNTFKRSEKTKRKIYSCNSSW